MDDLFQYACDEGIIVEYCSLPLNESMSVQDDDGDIVLMDYSLINTSANERVHLAHELGHCVTGSFYNPYAAKDVRMRHENRADKWAIEKMISRSSLDEAVANGHTDLWDLADYFNVTVGFMQKAVCWYVHGNLAADLYF